MVSKGAKNFNFFFFVIGSTYHTSTFICSINLSIGMSICLDAILVVVEFLLGCCRTFLVCLFVEVGKEEEEHDTMQSDPDHESFWIITFAEQQLELMGEDSNELYLKIGDFQSNLTECWRVYETYHLESCKIFFPPYEFLVFWSHCCHHVVKVHYDVDE